MLWAFACLLCSNLKAQVQTARYISMTGMSNAFYEYLPQGYSSTSQNYPLLIFCHGSGEYGFGTPTDITKVLKNGTPKQINQGIFPTYFVVNADTFRYIVLSPQFIQYPSPQDINNIIDYAIQNYRIDINRIYLTGLSAGGGMVWDYIGTSTTYANRIAAVVPVCGFAWPTLTDCEPIATSGVRVWATHNNGDPTVPCFYTVAHVDYTNSFFVPQPDSLAKRTIFISNSHDAWTQTYNLNFTENGLNVYKWMLQYKRSYEVLSVNGLVFNAHKKNSNQVLLQWTTTREANNKGFEVQHSTNGSNFTAIGFVNGRGTNGNGASYDFSDISPVAGKNFYRLKQIDLDNKAQYSPVRFVDLDKTSGLAVYPNPVSSTLNIISNYNFTRPNILIRDAGGRLLIQSPANNGTNSFDVQKFAAGKYFVEMSDGTTILKTNFIKQ